MSDESLVEETKTEAVFIAPVEIESSEDPPMEEWSSYILDPPQTNKKKILYSEGLYDPGIEDVCDQYIAQSDSDVFRHPYYNYPAVLDPGIERALFSPEEKVVYADDGQELYLALCSEMSVCPVRSFHRGLLEEVIDLKYYCVDPVGVRPISIALTLNRYVKVLDLTDNFLNYDACYHLGEMLSRNTFLQELNLSGCRIGPYGAKRIFAGLPTNRALKVLNLNKNQLTDHGTEFFAQTILKNIDVQNVYLSYNNIGAKGAGALAEAFETYNKFTHIDLSWNNLYSPAGTFNLLSRLSENKVLQELNLSWNSLSGARLGTAIRNATAAPSLRHLDLSNNRLNGEAIKILIAYLHKPKKLITLDLSFNPMSPEDANNILQKIKAPAVKVHRVLMNNVYVDDNFLMLLATIKEIKSKRNLVVTYGGVIGGFNPKGADPRELLLERAEFLAKKPKKRPVDIALVVMQILKDGNVIMPSKDFMTAVQRAGAPLDLDLLEEITNVWAGPKAAKSKTIDVGVLVDYMKRKWPDRKLPPTPPPEPEPEPLPEPKRKGKGGKKK